MTMERISKIKEQLIENRRELSKIAQNEKLEFNCITGYKNEAFLRVEVLNVIFNELALELKSICADEEMYYAIIDLVVAKGEEEPVKEEVKETVFLTVEDLIGAKVDIEFVEARLITINESEAIEEIEPVIIEEPVIKEAVILNNQENEFWRLVETEEKKVADKSRMTLVKEIFGCDISSIQNSKAKEIGEDEYVDLGALTYEDEEIWKTIKSTKYQVSTLGRVRNSVTFEIIKPFESAGMMVVKIDNSYLPLAGLTFSLFNKEVTRDIQHIDNDINNNHILNLRKYETLVA